MSAPAARVLVTGGTGFIGLNTILRLLQLGYPVRATVRAGADEASLRNTLSAHADASRLELVCADLCDDAGWREAAAGCQFVIHAASPYPAVDPKDEQELFVPAREGTLRVLRAAHGEGVRRVVMLSTIGAVYGGHERENRTFDETDWSDLEKTFLAYHTSKTLAERAAWDFIRSAENTAGMEMVSICPSNVFGPVLDGHYHTATEYYRTIMRREVPGVSRTQLDLVDVRDLVDIFAKALTLPGAANKRFICNGASIPMAEFAEILQRNFSKRGYRVPTRILPDALIRVFALFMPKVRSVARQLKWKYAFSTEQLRSVFGWQPVPYEKTVVDMAESLIDHGLV